MSEIALRGTEWERILDASRNSVEYGAGSVAELIKKFSKVFKLLGFNSEVVYPESWTSVKALSKVYGWSEGYVKGVLSKKFGDPDEFVADVRGLLEKVSKAVGKPRAYYAILKMDGDNMGKVISGKRGMLGVEAYLETTSNVENFKKPVTPPVHQTITRSLAGGDDVLALLPPDRAVEVAFRLQGEFREDWDGFDYLQGRTRSMSGGILIVHYKEPLYHAYSLVSGLEHLAKESGRNALAIGYLTHSGSYYRVVVNWDVFEGEALKKLLELLGEEDKLSTKFIYEVMTDIERWPERPEAITELFKFELGRHSKLSGEERVEVLKMFHEVTRHVRPVSLPKETFETFADAITVNPEHQSRAGDWPEVLFKVAEKKDVPPGEVAKVMKEQLRGALLLLKILREMGVGS